MSAQFQVTFDAHDPRTLSLFWRDVLGYVHPAPPGVQFAADQDPLDAWDEFLAAAGVAESERNNASAIEDPAGVGPRIFFQKVPEGTRSRVSTPDGAGELVSVKNKLHLDVRAAPGLSGDERMAALEAEAERLIALGATRIERFEPNPPMGAGHVVMADPEGNVFCLD